MKLKHATIMVIIAIAIKLFVLFFKLLRIGPQLTIMAIHEIIFIVALLVFFISLYKKQ